MALLSLLWGSEWLANLQLSDLPHLRVIAVRCLIAASLLLPFALRNRPDQTKLDYGREHNTRHRAHRSTSHTVVARDEYLIRPGSRPVCRHAAHRHPV